MTKLQAWVTAERGRASALAAHLCISRSRISQMCEAGVPTKYMLKVRDFTANEVTLEDMVADHTSVELSQLSTSEVGHG